MTTKPNNTKQRTGIYQIRNTYGRKLAEFQSRDEATNFLNGRSNEYLEIWHLENNPGELKGIYPASEFMNKQALTV
jgi:hypothetical protein